MSQQSLVRGALCYKISGVVPMRSIPEAYRVAVFGPWLTACAVACGFDVSPHRPSSRSQSDAGANWRPVTGPVSEANPIRSGATSTGGASSDQQQVETDSAELDGSDAAAQSMPSSPGRECEPGTQQCQGNTVLTCASTGLWSDALACAASQQCRDGVCTELPSCAGGGAGLDDCAGARSCCESQLIPGGSFHRSYTSDVSGQATDLAAPATLTSFRLDKYEVTVGRFRRFVAAWRAGTSDAPALGVGKHDHLHAGRGLRVVGGAYEPGWTAADTENVAPTDANLLCDLSAATWAPLPAGGETLPINCMSWAEAKAFCIWDGGFLPTEAEWEYAAAGGAQQRKYPWGVSAPGVTNEYAIYGCLYPSGVIVPGSTVGVCNGGNLPPVGTARLGVARWGQLDLGGGLWEWTLDSSETDALSPTYLGLCEDCVDLSPSSQRLVRGGQYENSEYTLQPTFRKLASAGQRYPGVGFRCARPP